MGGTFKQASFVGGELAPALHARTDLARYATGLALCQNFLVRPHGGVRNRPGLAFVREAKTSSRKARLVPFVYCADADYQSYALEFGDGYVRFHLAGGTVLGADGAPYEVASPYHEADLSGLSWAQSGDVLTVVHPGYPPQELRRYGHAQWTFAAFSNDRRVPPPSTLSFAACSDPAPDSTHPVSPWQWAVTAVSTDGEESLPSPTYSLSCQLWPDRAGTLSWHAPTLPDGVTIDYYNVYRGREGMLGYVGASRTTSYYDEAKTPVMNQAPPQGKWPFEGDGNYPSAVCYFDQRLVFAGTRNQPQTIWISQSGNRRSFDRAMPPNDNDSSEFSVSSLQANPIRGLVPLRLLVALTAGAEYAVSGTGGDPLTATSIQVRPQSYRGASALPPLVVGNAALYVQAHGSAVRDLLYDFESDGYGGSDLSLWARHLLDGHRIVEWAYAESPDGVVWAVREDGLLLGLTYLREQEVCAWSRHVTDGAVESVAVIPESGEDTLYAVVRRTVGGEDRRYVERLTTRNVSDVRDGCFVDAAVRYDGRNAGSATRTLSGGAAWARGETLDALASDSAWTAADVGEVLVVDAPDGSSVSCRVVTVEDPARARVVPDSDVPAALRGVAVSSWAMARARFRGLDHLEGKTVAAVSDGDVTTPVVVAGGTVSLSRRGVRVVVGLPYVSELETLNLSVQGTEIRDRKRIVSKVSAEVEATRGLLFGVDRGQLDEFRPPFGTNESRPMTPVTGLAQVLVSGKWDDNGRIVVRQEAPLPAAVLSVLPEVSFGG